MTPGVAVAVLLHFLMAHTAVAHSPRVPIPVADCDPHRASLDSNCVEMRDPNDYDDLVFRHPAAEPTEVNLI